MIPRLRQPGPSAAYAAFAEALAAAGFTGDIATALSDRIALSTDNSVYQLLPECILYPRDRDDLARIARLAAEPRFRDIRLAPRGGGTGTNGQSLTSGAVVDASRHMNRILEIDPAGRRVRVEAGVVKDQLNAALRPHGLFFAPELSTSNRATIGGMVSTDASGQGSCIYGKTRHHVRALTVVLLGGETWTARPVDDAALAAIKARDDRVGAVHRVVDAVHRENLDLIAATFPPLNRSVTGYDLAHVRTEDGRFDLTSILCGSEGTLGLIAEAELAVLPIPARTALVVVGYGDFDAALRDARFLMGLGPSSIETIDGTVLSLARSDPTWPEVAPHFPAPDGEPLAGVNIVEFSADDDGAIAAALARVSGLLGTGSGGRRAGYRIAERPEDVRAIWAMRKKAVGLLGDIGGRQRPIPFVEDTAVPPEALADYVAGFRAILDGRGLRYGMFGHVDAGVLHVRPAIDMTDPAERPLIRAISDAIFALSRKHGGVLWGEHGKGVRSEYAPAFFGALYPALQAVKAAFDPHDQLNPGKIATGPEGRLLRIDEVPFIGARLAGVAEAAGDPYGNAFACNGNGACFDFDLDAVMCPSWKGTRDRRHSPKGRATLVREWLRMLRDAGTDIPAEAGRERRGAGWRTLPTRIARTLRGGDDFSREVWDVLDGCLGCKACAGTCPSKVDVPAFRARFLELYHGRYLCGPADWLVGSVEGLLLRAVRAPRLYNAVAGNGAGRWLAARLGLVALPDMATGGPAAARRRIATATPAAIAALPAAERSRAVVIVSDPFTDAFTPDVVLDLADTLRLLGHTPWRAPALPNGKPAHFQGQLGRFERIARRQAAALNALAAAGVPLVGVDPAMTLAFRDEYRKALGPHAAPPVRLMQEWLAARLAEGERAPVAAGGRFRLLPHCTERSNARAATEAWGTVFAHAGLALEILPAGCCGMAGTFGHLARHRAVSERIYAGSWANAVAAHAGDGGLLATGYSCRSQAGIVDGVALPHPVSVLRRALAAGAAVRPDAAAPS